MRKIQVRVPREFKEAFGFMLIVLVAAWLVIGTIFLAMQMPWPPSDTTHMRDCANHGGKYVKYESKHGTGKGWTCDGKVQPNE